jgi:hypothetical protein
MSLPYPICRDAPVIDRMSLPYPINHRMSLPYLISSGCCRDDPVIDRELSQGHPLLFGYTRILPNSMGSLASSMEPDAFKGKIGIFPLIPPSMGPDAFKGKIVIFPLIPH